MGTREQNINTFEEIRDQYIGPMGSPERKDHDRGFELFMVGVSIAQAREAQGLTQEQLAKKCGIAKAVVNKAEMEAENVKISVLQNIIENGLGGRLQLSVQF
ncbi:helix-turn-helix domain-containing protein [Mucilaginibacter myungsuensis]|uniref:Helix-turn-helix transcriptional regulator n=1 Tax=Mucilaginibacter myungsuensis TaxID=649104 RepID=A0A929KX12_9SPHI|nr:helix-turn-helix transcriptional regulator [Mucilaginibacter myungsuensis]MBE9663206.1 helix-turn-helix transcriptional regulator [Mucilaginibacter myungsuensis]MDN3598839.1 helix-turn-helix transcriptional regulator [Mucilaginibacter myungsuensis]